MLLKRRPPQIDTRPIQPAQGFEHLSAEAIAVLKWLKANQVEFVLVGPVAEAIRGGGGSPGPVAIVPAPYRRNFERLWRALDAAQARPRPDGGAKEGRDVRPAKMSPDACPGGHRWTCSAPARTTWTSRRTRAGRPATRSFSTRRIATSWPPA